MKKILAATLVFSSIALSSVSSFAEQEGTTPPSSSPGQVSLITPSSRVGYSSQSLTGQQISYAFNVTTAMPEWI